MAPVAKSRPLKSKNSEASEGKSVSRAAAPTKAAPRISAAAKKEIQHQKAAEAKAAADAAEEIQRKKAQAAQDAAIAQCKKAQIAAERNLLTYTIDGKKRYCTMCFYVAIK